jgi:hypothetical protein
MNVRIWPTAACHQRLTPTGSAILQWGRLCVEKPPPALPITMYQKSRKRGRIYFSFILVAATPHKNLSFPMALDVEREVPKDRVRRMAVG